MPRPIPTGYDKRPSAKKLRCIPRITYPRELFGTIIFPLSYLKLENNTRIPLVTLTLAAIMVILTNLWAVAGLCVPFSSACTPDWRTLSSLSALLVWLFVHPFVHLGFYHLAGDVAGFIFLGSLLEAWMIRIPKRGRYYILLAAYVIGIYLNLFYYMFRMAEAGASVMVFVLLPVALYYWFKFHHETRWLWSSLILIGLMLVCIPLGLSISQRLLHPSFEHLWGVWFGVLIVGVYKSGKDGFKVVFKLGFKR
jgi:hypothetical protein